jgi:hypothetical protein
MWRGHNETSLLKHETLCEIQSTEVFLSGYNTLCTFSHLLHEVKYKKKELKMKNENIETTSPFMYAYCSNYPCPSTKIILQETVYPFSVPLYTSKLISG